MSRHRSRIRGPRTRSLGFLPRAADMTDLLDDIGSQPPDDEAMSKIFEASSDENNDPAVVNSAGGESREVDMRPLQPLQSVQIQTDNILKQNICVCDLCKRHSLTEERKDRAFGRVLSSKS